MAKKNYEKYQAEIHSFYLLKTPLLWRKKSRRFASVMWLL